MSRLRIDPITREILRPGNCRRNKDHHEKCFHIFAFDRIQDGSKFPFCKKTQPRWGNNEAEVSKQQAIKLEDQPDTKLNVSWAGSRVRAAKRDRTTGQRTEIAVVVVAEPPQLESFECCDVTAQRIRGCEALRHLDAIKVIGQGSARLTGAGRKPQVVDHRPDLSEDGLAFCGR